MIGPRRNPRHPMRDLDFITLHSYQPGYETSLGSISFVIFLIRQTRRPQPFVSMTLGTAERLEVAGHVGSRPRAAGDGPSVPDCFPQHMECYLLSGIRTLEAVLIDELV